MDIQNKNSILYSILFQINSRLFRTRGIFMEVHNQKGQIEVCIKLKEDRLLVKNSDFLDAVLFVKWYLSMTVRDAQKPV